MNKINWREAEQYNYNILDRINVIDYIKKYDTVDDIMEKIEADTPMFEAHIRAAIEDPYMKGEIFNYIGNYEFMDYLKKRYGTEFQEETKYYVIKEKDDTNK